MYKNFTRSLINIFRVRKGSVAKLNWETQFNGSTIAFRFPSESEIFLCVVMTRSPLDLSRLPVHWPAGVFSPGIKRQERYADSSSAPSAKLGGRGATLLFLYMIGVRPYNIELNAAQRQLPKHWPRNMFHM
jgi:hypothetical protein